MYDIENNIWFDVSILCMLFAIGNILMGHFEEGTPRWRRILKLFIATLVLMVLWTFLGRWVAWSFFGLLIGAVLYIHTIWLPKNGIHGWTGEPKDKYYELRGWDKK